MGTLNPTIPYHTILSPAATVSDNCKDELILVLPLSTHSAVEMFHDSALYKFMIDVDSVPVGCGCLLLAITSMPVNLLSPHNMSNSSMLSNVQRLNLPAVVVTAGPHVALPLPTQRATAANGKISLSFILQCC